MFQPNLRVLPFDDSKGRRIWLDLTPNAPTELVREFWVWHEYPQLGGWQRRYDYVGKVLLIWSADEVIIEDLIFREDYRRAGLGGFAMQQIIQLARVAGVAGISGWMQAETKEDWPALRIFYTRAGFALDGINFYRDLLESET